MQVITAFALIYVLFILFDRLIFVEYLVLYILKVKVSGIKLGSQYHHLDFQTSGGLFDYPKRCVLLPSVTFNNTPYKVLVWEIQITNKLPKGEEITTNYCTSLEQI